MIQRHSWSTRCYRNRGDYKVFQRSEPIVGEEETYIGQTLHKKFIYLITCISISGNSWCFPGVIYYTAGDPIWPKEHRWIWYMDRDLNRFQDIWALSGRGGSGPPPGLTYIWCPLTQGQEHKCFRNGDLSRLKIFGHLLFHGGQEYPWFSGQDPNRFLRYFVIPNSM